MLSTRDETNPFFTRCVTHQKGISCHFGLLLCFPIFEHLLYCSHMSLSILVFLHLLCFLILPFIHDLASHLARHLFSYPNINQLSSSKLFSVFHSSGDILGSAMQNLQNLLRMPYGCGEQNMVLFTPNIYVLNYLNETGQLTEKIKSKAISYLISGERLPPKEKH